MRNLIRSCALLVFLAALVGGCGDNIPARGPDAGADAEATAETSSALYCDQSTVVSNGHGGFTHLCLHWAPSTLPSGGPCGPSVPDGYVEVHTLPGYAGYCMVLSPNYYSTLGDWDTAAYQIRSMRVGARAYAFSFSDPGFASFASFDAPGSAEPDTTAWGLSSLELLLGQ